jgi:hypothetical protein
VEVCVIGVGVQHITPSVSADQNLAAQTIVLFKQGYLVSTVGRGNSSHQTRGAATNYECIT